MNSKNRLTALFETQRQLQATEGSANPLLTLFITAGYPDKSSFKELILNLDASGADILEIGMPFSDPLADGPVIQASSQKALDNGVDLEWIFSSIHEIRKETKIPILLMGYFNPILSFGIDAFFEKAAASGIDGIILPDLPAEEINRIRPFTDKYGLSVVGFVTPTSSDERIQLIDKAINGFIYTVLVTGVTGGSSGSQMTDEMRRFLSRVRQSATRNPILAGFGIQSSRDMDPVKDLIDGYIVGSELIRKINSYYPNEGWIKKVGDFVSSFKKAK